MNRYRPTRLPGNPVIRPEMDARMGGNIQGPSVIRVPDWVRDPLGRYYLYFADHKGAYIRLAYADAPEGPWRVHGPGSLTLADSLFPTDPPAIPADTGGGDRLPGRAPPGTPGVEDPLEDATHPHIASPDVHVDEANRRIVMYFHGLVGFRTQRSRVALSSDGIAFRALPELLGPSYFRVFRHGGWTYALAMPGIMFRSKDGLTGFERGPTLFPPTQRHTALRLRGDRLEVFWTRVGDLPESILLSEVDLTGDWMSWRAEGEWPVLRPVEPWEGANLPLAPSWRGAINAPVNQLRDPCIFEESGRVLLYYAVCGEAGIAVAELLPA
ncbi:hypothetical protein [Neoroseomonas lacus]|uniref:Uncharacterized protein n=1 Tax=Neoroseomonas lacus TaxID=287609 RepID=A0A917K602_9PROT|nr:hypothetical protein [Neoroseomonas lacus]GGJ01309.1 hypothetical protein GCM10011320_05150 [Neoroseomonas lacus]